MRKQFNPGAQPYIIFVYNCLFLYKIKASLQFCLLALLWPTLPIDSFSWTPAPFSKDVATVRFFKPIQHLMALADTPS